MIHITVTTDEESGLCPVRSILTKVSGKWQSLILLCLEDGPQRFSAIKRIVGDITQRVLTENLRSLERDGYLIRTVMPGPPVAVSYDLTERGSAFVELYKPLVLWAEASFDDITISRAAYDSRA